MRTLAGVLVLLPAVVAHAAPLILEGEVDAGGPAYLHVPFEVPAGTAEIEVRHDDLSAADILDFGLLDPERFRGWGGGNTEPIVLNEAAASRSYLPGPLPAGTWQVIIGKAKIGSSQARYRIEIEFRDVPTLPPQPERSEYAAAPALENGARWYAGDFHVHSRESGDARPDLDEIANFARGRGLDFVVVTDHNTPSHLDFFKDVQARHPSLLLVPGVEFTTYAGHANGIGATSFVDFRIGHEGRTIEDAAREVADMGAIFAINHPVLDLGDACIGCAWKHDLGREWVGAIEIQTGAWSKSGIFFGEQAIRFWDGYCATGFKVVAIGGSDDHQAGQGTSSLSSAIGSPTTMVFADALSESAILEAIRRGRTVVKLEGPGDPMVEVTAGDARIGDTVHGDTVLRAVVTGGMGDTLRWVRNGMTEAEVEITSDPFSHEVAAVAPADGEDRWRAEVRVDGTVRTITSHLWVAPPLPADEATGCGCATGGGTTLCGIALVLVALARRRAGTVSHLRGSPSLAKRS